MPYRHIVTPQATADAPQLRGALEESFQALRAELGLSTQYPQPAVTELEQTLAGLKLPERDESAVPFFTIDPPGSRDLDQAMYLERDGEGYRVRYAIAHVPLFVPPGGALDAATRERGQTYYCPDLRVPLHPALMSEDNASLLPEQVRPAFIWDLSLDAAADVVQAQVYPARVRSQQRWDYAQVQELIDNEQAPESLALLKEIGLKRIEAERARGGASLPMPEQEITLTESGYQMTFRPLLASEDWNAQISLMTGMAAAEMMLHAQVGILRTMPPADPQELLTFHRRAQALGVPWRAEVPYGEFLRTLDHTEPRHLALIHAATALFRGAGYTSFDGQIPENPEQAAVAAAYAHVTAPLRRLVDRFALVICAAISADEPIPDWVRQALPELPELMRKSNTVAGKVERGCADAVEAALLSTRVGQQMSATVVERGERDGLMVQLIDLPVLAPARGNAELGSTVTVTIEAADIAARQVQVVIVEDPTPL